MKEYSEFKGKQQKASTQTTFLNTPNSPSMFNQTVKLENNPQQTLAVATKTTEQESLFLNNK